MNGVYVWEAATGKRLQVLAKPSDFGRGPIFSIAPDDRSALVAERSCIRWQRRNDGRWEGANTKDPFIGRWDYHCIAFSGDGTLVALGLVKFGYAITGKHGRPPPLPPTFLLRRTEIGPLEVDDHIANDLCRRDIAAVTFFPDGKTVAVADAAQG